MRNKLLVALLLLVCFWHINVTAKENQIDYVQKESSAEIEGEVNFSENDAENDDAIRKKNEEIIVDSSPHEVDFSDGDNNDLIDNTGNSLVGAAQTPKEDKPTLPEGELEGLVGDKPTPAGEVANGQIEISSETSSEISTSLEKMSGGSSESSPEIELNPASGESSSEVESSPEIELNPASGESSLEAESSPEIELNPASGESSSEVESSPEIELLTKAEEVSPQVNLLGATRTIYSYAAQSKKANSVSDILKTILSSEGTVTVSSINSVAYNDPEGANNSLLTINGSTITPKKLFSTAVGIKVNATVKIKDNSGEVTTTTDDYIINVTSVPAHDKILTPNPAYDEDGKVITETVCDENNENCVERVKGDGTYKLSLTVTGEADIDTDKSGNVNVLVILDTSSSMIKRWAIDSKGSIGNRNFDSNHNQQDEHVNVNDPTNPVDYDDGGYFYLYKYDEETNTYTMLQEDEGYTGTVYRKTEAGSNVNPPQGRFVVYSGTRFIATRADKAEKTLYDFVNNLFDEYQSKTDPTNIQVALVGFSYNNPSNPNSSNNKTQVIQGWTSNKSDIIGTEENPKLSTTGKVETHKISIYQQGTNYEAGFEKGLEELNRLAPTDNDPTYVIFITDGQPSQDNDGPATIGQGRDSDRKKWYRSALDEAWDISQRAQLYGIYAFGDEDDYLDDLMYYVYNNQTDRTLDHDGDNQEDYNWNKTTHIDSSIEKYYYKAEDAGALEDAIGDIFQDISRTIGVSQTQIADGTTGSVTAHSGTLPEEGLLDVDTTSFEYWLSWKVNDDNTFRMFNSNDVYTYTVTADTTAGTVTFTRTGIEPVTYKGTLSSDKTIKIKWGDYYNSQPATTFLGLAPQVRYENNNVYWDLPGTLLDGVTYEVTFDVWPSQTTLDLQADLKNGKISYSSLSDTVKQYLDENGNLRTNTFATLKYDDTRTPDVDESQNPVSYPNPNPVSTTEIDEMVIAKEWLGYGVTPNITLTVERDGDEYLVIGLPIIKDENGNEIEVWQKTIFISVGILTLESEKVIDEDGNVSITYTTTAKTPGHDYSFQENIGDTELAYQWELRAPVLHPMTINNVLTMLVLEGSDLSNPLTHPSEMTSDYYYDTITGYKWYKINDTYYYESDFLASLTANNYRRSNLNITKLNADNSDANAPDDLFEFSVDLDYNPNAETDLETGERIPSGEKIWFSIYDIANDLYIINLGEDIYASEGTLEEKLPQAGVNITYSASTGILSYYTDPEDVTNVLVGTDYNYQEGSKYFTGYYCIDSDHISDLLIYLKAGWNVRFINIPTGSTYSITETNSANYILTKTETTATLLKGVSSDDATVGTKGTISSDKKTVTGTIDEPVTSYTATFTNKYEDISVSVEKIWDDADDRDNIRPDTINIQLYKTVNGVKETVGDPITLGILEEGQDPVLTYTWEHLPIYENGNDVIYSIEELLTAIITGDDGPGTYEIIYGGSLATGILVTNKHTPILTESTIIKVWDDASAPANTRPASISVQLLANDEAYGSPIVLNIGNNWTKRVTGLPTEIDGEEVTYTWIEDESGLPSGYILSNQTTNGTVTTITNKYEVVSATVVKVWKDGENVENTRPGSLTVTLSNGTTVTLNSENGWMATVNNLPVYDSNKNPITYTWTEGSLPTGYRLTGNSTEGTITTLTNTLETEATVVKVWKDGENAGNTRPGSLTVTLSNGTTVTLNSENGWMATVNQLPVYDESNGLITYTWTEGSLPTGYRLTGNSTEGTITTLTNTLETEATVVKVWDDVDNIENIRPVSLTVVLSDGTEVVLNEENEWTATVEQLPVYNEDNELIEYIWEETDLPEEYTLTGNSTECTVTTLTNTYVPKTEATIVKVWDDANNQDGIRPTSIKVVLSNGEEVTLSEENNWTATIKDLPKYAEGKEIEYMWTEDEKCLPEGYELTNTSVDGIVTTLTNSYTPEETEATIVKVWNDADDQDGIRPTSLVVILSNGTKVTLTAENNWTATIEHLPKYADGKEIEYSWEEELPEGYELTNTSVNGIVTTLENSHAPAKTQILVVKEWADDDNASGKRPANVTITLLANGKEYDEILLSEGNEWKHTFEDLPLYSYGEEITYSVVEKIVPDDYVVAYEKTEEGFIVHNVLGQGGDEPPEPPYNNPQTGDNIVLYLIALLISIIGLVSGKLYLRENN